MRATVKGESVFFSPWTFINFRFAPFAFANFTLMTPPYESLEAERPVPEYWRGFEGQE